MAFARLLFLCQRQPVLCLQVRGEAVVVATALMRHRDRESYRVVFERLRDHMLFRHHVPSPTLRKFIIDCEQAAILEIEHVFGPDGVVVELCLFHFDSNIRDKICSQPNSLQVHSLVCLFFPLGHEPSFRFFKIADSILGSIQPGWWRNPKVGSSVDGAAISPTLAG